MAESNKLGARSRPNRRRNVYLSWIGAALFVVSVFETPAAAYIDPGSGSYLFQMMVAGLVGGAFAIRTYWTKIKEFFKNLFGKR